MKLMDIQTEFVSVAYLLSPVKRERAVCFDIAEQMGVTCETYTQPDVRKLFETMLFFRDVEGGPDFYAISNKSGLSVESIRDIAETKDRSGYFEYHTGILRGLEKRRALVAAGHAIERISVDDACDADYCAALAEEALLNATKRMDMKQSGGMVADMAEQRIKHYQANYRDGIGGLRTGITWLDNILGNLHPGRVYLLSGETKTGKTTVLRKVASLVSGRGERCSFATLELLPDEVFDMMVCASANIPIQELQKANEIRYLEKFTAHAEQMKQHPLFLAGGPMTPSYFQAWARREVAKGSKLILLDYLQALTPEARAKEQNDEKIMSAASKAVLSVALTCKIPVLAIATESNAGVLRYSGQIGYDCAAHLRLTAREDGSGPDCETKFIRHGKKPDAKQSLYFWHGDILTQEEFAIKQCSWKPIGQAVKTERETTWQ